MTDITVPASIANLGPAFDTLSVAVQLYTRVRIVDVRPSTPDVIESVFVDGPLDGENRIETAFHRARVRCGRSVPGVRIEVRSEIPQRAGLGSSAAATVAGLQLYEALTSASSRSDWLPIATGIEGHPDNAAAALFGGLTASCQHDDGRVTVHTWRWPSDVKFVVATPAVPLDTAHARQVLPPTIPVQDAVFNLQRTVLLLRALETGRYDQLREALRDRLHQPSRAPLVPVLTEAIALDHPSVLGVCLSGAGPSVVALANGQETVVARVLGALYDRLAVPHTIRILSAHQPIDVDAGLKSGATTII